MKKKYIYTVIIAWGILIVGESQEQKYTQGAVLTYGEIQKNGRSLEINWTVDYSDLRIGPHTQVTLQPLLAGTRDTLYMPCVWLVGKKREKKIRRKASTHPLQCAGRRVYKVVCPGPDESRIVDYSLSIPFWDWMYGAQLEISQISSSRANSQKELPSLLAGAVESLPQYIPQVTFLVPKVENVKMRKERGEAFLNFPKGQSDIQPQFANNQAELDKVDQTVQRILDDAYVKCTGIELHGYTSPDGPYRANKQLSAARAIALKKYIQDKYRLGASFFFIDAASEDWATIRAWTQNSNLPYKALIVEIIDRVEDPDARESSIRQLDAGESYALLEEKVFPQLRRVVYLVDYVVVPFTVREGKKIMQLHPRQLSSNELFLIADTYPRESRQFREVIDLAVSIYPDDLAANNNAAAVALMRGETDKARLYLNRIADTIQIQNNWGVLHWLEGDLVKAGECFQKAKISGSGEEATVNLQEIKKISDKK